MMHISASTAPIRVKQKPLDSKLNAESDKHYNNSLCKSLENSPESLAKGKKYYALNPSHPLLTLQQYPLSRASSSD